MVVCSSTTAATALTPARGSTGSTAMRRAQPVFRHWGKGRPALRSRNVQWAMSAWTASAARNMTLELATRVTMGKVESRLARPCRTVAQTTNVIRCCNTVNRVSSIISVPAFAGATFATTITKCAARCACCSKPLRELSRRRGLHALRGPGQSSRSELLRRHSNQREERGSSSRRSDRTGPSGLPRPRPVRA